MESPTKSLDHSIDVSLGPSKSFPTASRKGVILFPVQLLISNGQHVGSNTFKCLNAFLDVFTNLLLEMLIQLSLIDCQQCSNTH